MKFLSSIRTAFGYGLDRRDANPPAAKQGEYLDDLLMPRVKHLQTNLVNAETGQTLQVIKSNLTNNENP